MKMRLAVLAIVLLPLARRRPRRARTSASRVRAASASGHRLGARPGEDGAAHAAGARRSWTRRTRWQRLRAAGVEDSVRSSRQRARGCGAALAGAGARHRSRPSRTRSSTTSVPRARGVRRAPIPAPRSTTSCSPRGSNDCPQPEQNRARRRARGCTAQSGSRSPRSPASRSTASRRSTRTAVVALPYARTLATPDKVSTSAPSLTTIVVYEYVTFAISPGTASTRRRTLLTVSGCVNVDAAAAYAERHALHALLVQRGGDVVFEQLRRRLRRGQAARALQRHEELLGRARRRRAARRLARRRRAGRADAPGLVRRREGARAAARSLAAHQRDRLRRLGQRRAVVRCRDRRRAEGRAARDVHLRRHPAASVRRRAGAQARAARALAATTYLRERILDPIGLRIGSWRTLKDGTQPLPTGAFVTAREWRKFGVLVRDGGTWEKKTIVPRAALARCFTGSDANPRYGLGWWLSPLPKHPDVVYASGAGGQAMYVIPSAGRGGGEVRRLRVVQARRVSQTLLPEAHFEPAALDRLLVCRRGTRGACDTYASHGAVLVTVPSRVSASVTRSSDDRS